MKIATNSSYVIKPPAKIDLNINPKSVFLAGSIEMGKAIDWQKQLEKEFERIPVTIFNPRRDDWDSSWKQEIGNKQFYEQVNWELTALEKADIVVMYFAPGTQSPISLLELGLFARDYNSKLVVCCPDGFWRQGNVEIVCQRYGVPFHRNIDTWILNIKTKLSLI